MLLPRPRRWKFALVCLMFLAGGLVLVAILPIRWADRIAAWMYQ